MNEASSVCPVCDRVLADRGHRPGADAVYCSKKCQNLASTRRRRGRPVNQAEFDRTRVRAPAGSGRVTRRQDVRPKVPPYPTAAEVRANRMRRTGES